MVTKVKQSDAEQVVATHDRAPYPRCYCMTCQLGSGHLIMIDFTNGNFMFNFEHNSIESLYGTRSKTKVMIQPLNLKP